MRFTCLRENLSQALNIAERFIGKNVSLPILSNLLLETVSSALKISATNLEYALETTIPGEVMRPGKVSVPAKVIGQLISSLTEDKLELEEKQKNLFLKTSSREIKINGTSPEDFPIIPKIKKSAGFTADGWEIKLALEKVLPSVSVSEFKPELTGVFFRVNSKTLTLAATDTFRLAEESVKLINHENNSFSFILPQRACQELVRILDAEEGEVKTTLGENQTEFVVSKTRIISRLIEGNFPEYSTIIPKNFETSSFVKRKELNDAIRASAIFASKLQEVTLFLSRNSIEITSANPEVGEYKTKIPAVLSGKEVKISFNLRYLLDGIGALEEEEIFLGFNSTESPAMLRNKSVGNFLYVLMPLRVA